MEGSFLVRPILAGDAGDKSILREMKNSTGEAELTPPLKPVETAAVTTTLEAMIARAKVGEVAVTKAGKAALKSQIADSARADLIWKALFPAVYNNVEKRLMLEYCPIPQRPLLGGNFILRRMKDSTGEATINPPLSPIEIEAVKLTLNTMITKAAQEEIAVTKAGKLTLSITIRSPKRFDKVWKAFFPTIYKKVESSLLDAACNAAAAAALPTFTPPLALRELTAGQTRDETIPGGENMPVDPEVKLLKPDGTTVVATAADPVYDLATKTLKFKLTVPADAAPESAPYKLSVAGNNGTPAIFPYANVKRPVLDQPQVNAAGGVTVNPVPLTAGQPSQLTLNGQGLDNVGEVNIRPYRNLQTNGQPWPVESTVAVTNGNKTSMPLAFTPPYPGVYRIEFSKDQAGRTITGRYVDVTVEPPKTEPTTLANLHPTLWVGGGAGGSNVPANIPGANYFDIPYFRLDASVRAWPESPIRLGKGFSVAGGLDLNSTTGDGFNRLGFGLDPRWQWDNYWIGAYLNTAFRLQKNWENNPSKFIPDGLTTSETIGAAMRGWIFTLGLDVNFSQADWSRAVTGSPAHVEATSAEVKLEVDLRRSVRARVAPLVFEGHFRFGQEDDPRPITVTTPQGSYVSNEGALITPTSGGVSGCYIKSPYNLCLGYDFVSQGDQYADQHIVGGLFRYRSNRIEVSVAGRWLSALPYAPAATARDAFSLLIDLFPRKIVVGPVGIDLGGELQLKLDDLNGNNGVSFNSLGVVRITDEGLKLVPPSGTGPVRYQGPEGAP